ncbi:putative RING finger domain protein [Aspergillus affinis]|uniref:putative RING finger domain protein n=1 Tax=Aspergillus affinis TaxID=1070780 RepID=UPI0022FE8958|nr:uncharacterized protein KD926_003554 [Aspergillus affinis]KAI9043403.1 hypothetical protein KD926_003554 [Aspergillus affinis]
MASTNTEASPTPPATALSPFFRTLPPLLPLHSWFSGPSTMNNDSGVQFVAARPRKRDHREMTESHSRQSWRQNAEASSSRSHPRRPSSPPPPLRYPGDGLDFRRPAQSTAQGAVIDLTNEPDSPPQTFQSRGTNTGGRSNTQPRPPRFGRPIMTEVVDLEEEPEASGQAPSSPEVQFIGSSVRPPLARPREHNFGNDLLQMLHLHDPRIHGVPRRDVFREEVARRARQIARHPPLDVDAIWVGGPGSAMDLTSFNLDMDLMFRNFTTPPDRGPPASSYKPPSPAPEGFTRTVGEDEVVCCPNCDAELGVGDDTKQQIWVAKQCGHVYCGECATHRSKSSAKKAASQRVKPFSKCQVFDCGKSVSAPKAMFQVFI